MGKTYNTISTFVSGAILTANQMNGIGTNVNNYRVPPAIQLVRTTAINPYTSGAAITWSSATYDTESPSDPMWSSGGTVTIRTAGIYLITASLDIRTTSALTGNCYVYTGGTLASYSIFREGSNPRVVANFIASYAVGNTVDVRVDFAGGGTVQINGAASGADQSRLNLTWLGQVS